MVRDQQSPNRRLKTKKQQTESGKGKWRRRYHILIPYSRAHLYCKALAYLRKVHTLPGSDASYLEAGKIARRQTVRPLVNSSRHANLRYSMAPAILGQWNYNLGKPYPDIEMRRYDAIMGRRFRKPGLPERQHSRLIRIQKSEYPNCLVVFLVPLYALGVSILL